MNEKKKILIIDDVMINLEAGKNMLEEIYDVYEAESAKEGLDLMETMVPDLILLDIIMPEIDGYQMIRILKENRRLCKIPVIFLTAATGMDSEIKGFEYGAVDYITKPFVPAIMRQRVATQLSLSEYEKNLEALVDEKVAEIERMQNLISVSLAELVESRDGITGGHIKNTYIYFKAFIEELAKLPEYQDELTPQFVKFTIMSAPLHDVGKIAIKDAVLQKEGNLNEAEFEYMKTHSIIGGRTFNKIRHQVGDEAFISIAEDMALYHHEKWDGTGYPSGLKGKDIPLAARIMTIVDVYDALTSKRPYKEPFSHEKAMDIIVAGRGTAFDPDLTDHFVEIKEKIKDRLAHKKELTFTGTDY